MRAQSGVEEIGLRGFHETLRHAAVVTLRLGLDRLDPRKQRAAYSATTFSMGLPPGVNLDKALQLAAQLEDDETARKLQVRK